MIEYSFDGEKLKTLIALEAANRGVLKKVVRGELKKFLKNPQGVGISNQLMSMMEHSRCGVSLPNLVRICNFFKLDDFRYLIKGGQK